MNTTIAEKTVKEIVVGKCWIYLNDNFHKFTEANKLKVALALSQKDMRDLQTVIQNIMNMPTIKKDGKPMEFQIGDNRTSEHTQYP